MPDILKPVDALEEKNSVISLGEIEKSFDNIAKSPEDQKSLVNALDKLLSDKLSDKKTKYDVGFDYHEKIKEIAKIDKNLTYMDEVDIKVYQLCKNLENKSKGIDKYIEINGKIGPEMISDRVDFYNVQGIGLLSGSESLNYNKDTNELIVKTQFGEYKKMLSGTDPIIDNTMNCKTFVDNERSVLFNDFLKSNTITAQEFETIVLGTNKKININYKNANAYIEKSFSLDVSAGMNNENILKFIQEKRDEYKGALTERTEYTNTISEIDNVNKKEFINEYNNIKLLLGENEYKKFVTAGFNLRNLSEENIGNMHINDAGNLVVGEGKNSILKYDFSTLSQEKKQLIIVNISNILTGFVAYFPNHITRLQTGKINTIKDNVNYQKEVIALYNALITEQNIAKFKEGSLDLNKFNTLYINGAFQYFIGELQHRGEDMNKIVKKWTMNAEIFKFLEKKKDSKEIADYVYVELYYKFIEAKLGNVLYNNKNDATGSSKKLDTKREEYRSLDETKINVVPSTTYKWLMFQKNERGDALATEEVNKKVVELTTKNKRLQGLSQEQQDILLKTDMGKGLLKGAIYSIEQKKYKAATDAFQAVPDDGKPPTSVEAIYKQKVARVYNSIAQADKWLNGTDYESIGSSKNDDFNGFQKNHPDFAKYIRYNKNKITGDANGVGGFELDRDAAVEDIFALRKPFEEAWVQYMKKLNEIGLTQYIEWTVPGQTGKVNMAEVINNPKRELIKIDSPYSDGYCKSKMNFGNGTPSEIVRDSDWEKIKDWFSDKRDDIEHDPLNGIASTTIDISGIVAGGVVAGVVTEFAGPQAGALAFTAVDNLIRAQGYGALETVNYLAGTGDYKDQKSISLRGIMNAGKVGNEKGLGVVQQETSVYGKTSYVKDAKGEVVMKDWEVILAEKALEIGSSLILFGPVGKVGQVVEKSVFNKMIANNLEKEFGADAMSKIFTKDVSKLRTQDLTSMFGKEVVTSGTKVVSRTAGFLGEVSTFTAFNAVYNPFSTFVVTGAQEIANQAKEHKSDPSRTLSNVDLGQTINAASDATEQAWKDSFSLLGLTTNFIHNVGFIGLLKGSNLLADPISSRIMNAAQKTKYINAKPQADILGKALATEMAKEGVDFLTKGKIITDKIKIAPEEIAKISNTEEGGFFKKTAEGYIYVDPTAVPKITSINDKITALKVQTSSLIQSLAAKTEKIKDIQGIKDFNEFVVKNNLEGVAVTPEIILQKRIAYCENKIKNTEGTDKIKYKDMVEKLNKQQMELTKLREGYNKSIELITIDDEGNINTTDQTKSEPEKTKKSDIETQTETQVSTPILQENINAIEENNKVVDKSIEDLTNLLENNGSEMEINKIITKIGNKNSELYNKIMDIQGNPKITDKSNEIRKLRKEISDQHKTSENQDDIKVENNNVENNKEIAIIVEEGEKVIKEIKNNQYNILKLKSIVSDITNKIKEISKRINQVIDGTPTYKKAKDVVQALFALSEFKEAIIELANIKTNGKNIIENIGSKNRYSLTGSFLDLAVNLAIFGGVTVNHIDHMLHGEISSGFATQHTFVFVEEFIKNTSEYTKENFIRMEEQKISYKKLQQLEKEDISDINKEAILDNYKAYVKGLSNGLKAHQHTKVIDKFLNNYHPSVIDETISISDLFDHILQKIENNEGSIVDHRQNLHELASMINPDKIFHKNVYNIVKNVFTGYLDFDRQIFEETTQIDRQNETAAYARGD